MEKAQLTYDWQPYDHDYCKAMQDIRLKDGREIMECWPNAGVWIRDGDEHYSDADVTHVRKSKVFYSNK